MRAIARTRTWKWARMCAIGGLDGSGILTGEVLRYLGYGRHEADWRVMDLVEQCIEELGREASPLYLCRDYPLALGQEGLVDAGGFHHKKQESG